MFILIGPSVRHFSDGNQRYPTLKNKSWPPLCQNNVNGVYIKFVKKNVGGLKKLLQKNIKNLKKKNIVDKNKTNRRK
jgi:hypothetical protein